MIRLLATFIFCTCVSFFTSSSQTVYDLKSAKAIALSEGKLIILDFWATWCKPCKNMDTELWSSSKFRKMSNKFVLAKIDVDDHPGIASSFQVKGIPRVLVMSANKDIFLDKLGFRTAEDFLRPLSKFPENYSSLNAQIAISFETKKVEPRVYYNMGQEYSKLAQIIPDKFLKNKFFIASNTYLKKSLKNHDSESLKSLTELSILKNNAHQGLYKKALKKLEKLDLDQNSLEVANLKNYILAYCFKCDGDMEKFEKAKKKIKNEELLTQLKN
jgi:thiol-disulfide isomerase/thioredoxin